jgi:hypothetical protein
MEAEKIERAHATKSEGRVGGGPNKQLALGTRDALTVKIRLWQGQ